MSDTKNSKNEVAPAKTKKLSKPKKSEQKTKKAPSLFLKKYTAAKLEKKIYKKIHIPDDKHFVKSFIKETGSKQGKKDTNISLFSIPEEELLTLKDYNRLKLIAKEIKKQRGRVKFIPLIAVLVFIAAFAVTFTLTKNFILRKVITSSCESIFEAKCDIDYLNFKFFDSSFKLNGLQIADKNAPMKNLISVERIAFDFDLVQLLRARFVADELSITGVATNTDRTYSGDISEQRRAKIAKKKAKKAARKAKKTEDSAFMKSLTAKSDAALNTLKTSVTGLFDQYNPQTIIQNCYSQMQTPDTAKEVTEKTKELITKYSSKPEEIQKSVDQVKKTAEAVAAIDIQKVKTDPVKIKEIIETLTSAKSEIENLKTETENAINGMSNDVTSVKNYTKELESAVKHDKNLVENEISKFTSLSLDDGKRFITGTFDSVAYQFLGKYYPYVKKAVDTLVNYKESGKAKEEKAKKAKAKEKEKSTIADRAQGRTVLYKADTPKFWIKKASGSGPNFAFSAIDISSDMNLTGRAASGNLGINFGNIEHKADLIVDTRTDSKAPLITADYKCGGLPLKIPTSMFGDAPGVPGIETKSVLGAIFKIYEDEGFDITGSGNFTDMNITAIDFEPEFASTIYKNVLAGINSMKLDITGGYTASDGVNLNLYSDVDKQFISALSKEMVNQLGLIKEKAEAELLPKINEITGGAFGELNSFSDITSKIQDYADYAQSLSNQVNEKLAEAQKALTGKAQKAVEDATKAATDKAKDALGSKLKNLF
ncbi:MAG: TIGR03545 family protein [Treponema sp.]|nr:TIGR03545 family protein [Treponema sp.]